MRERSQLAMLHLSALWQALALPDVRFDVLPPGCAKAKAPIVDTPQALAYGTPNLARTTDQLCSSIGSSALSRAQYADLPAVDPLVALAVLKAIEAGRETTHGLVVRERAHRVPLCEPIEDRLDQRDARVPSRSQSSNSGRERARAKGRLSGAADLFPGVSDVS